MSVSDSVGDIITRIKNANLIRLTKIDLKKTNLIYEIISILSSEGFIEFDTNLHNEFITVKLKYKGTKQKPYITNIIRVSKPGLRVYVNAREIPRVWGGIGLCLLSTSKGVLTGHVAKKYNVGGEVLFYIW